MGAPATAADLLDLVARSGLADAGRLRGHVADLTASESLTAAPADCAAALVRAGFVTRFQSEMLLQGKWKGFAIGPYTLLERIGTGNTAAFFLAEDTRLERVATLKVLPPASASLPTTAAKFLREARVTASLGHPNIVRAYEANQIGDLYFLALEYVDGAALYDVALRGPLDPVRVAHCVSQAAAALQYVHDRGLVHRNVKPQKFLLDRRGRVKLCGFGLALVRQNARQLSESVCGTPNFIAPEQAVDSASVDGRADIYSLGCTAYHLLTGRPPFPDGSSAEKLIWHQTREPEPVRSLRPEVPEEMARVVARMMGKSPEERYQSAAEVAEALAPWCATPAPAPAADEMPDHCPRVREAVARSARTVE
jgi:serine/threonine protein kinase